MARLNFGVKPMLATSVLALQLAYAVGAAAEETKPLDQITLKNGSVIHGTITATRDGVVTVETDFAGTLSVAQDQVEAIQSQQQVVVKLKDGTVVKDQPLEVEGEELVVHDSPGLQQEYPLADLAILNPEPWELGVGYRWTGLVSAALTLERGNTDTDELDYKLESYWRSLQDRYTLKWSGERDEANGETNAKNWTAIGKYDYFLNEPWYWGFNAAAESDHFADLDLRYYVGPYLGRQFYDAPVFTLSAEAGVVYVNEDFIIAHDKEYPGMNWTVNASSNILGGDSRLYLDHNGILNLKDGGDLIANTTFGLAFPLMYSIEAAAEVLLEYDGAAPSEVDKLDQTYRFRIGYTW